MSRFLRRAIPILLVAGHVWAYVPRRLPTPSGMAFEKWSDSAFPITWRLNTAAGSSITGTRTLLETARAAFTSWSSIPTAKVSFTEGPPAAASAAALDGANVVAVSQTALTSGAVSVTVIYSYSATGNDPLGRAIAFPGQILEADILLNPNVAFSTEVNAATGRVHLESQLRHEIGHFLGLDARRKFLPCARRRPPKFT